MAQIYMAELQGRQKLAKRAYEIAKQRLDNVIGRLSLEICNAMKPEYRKQVAGIVEAFLEVARAADNEKQWRAELELAGYNTSSLPYLPGNLSRQFLYPNDYNSNIRNFLRQCEELEYLKVDDFLPPPNQPPAVPDAPSRRPRNRAHRPVPKRGAQVDLDHQQQLRLTPR